jgi:cell division protein FtsB
MAGQPAYRYDFAEEQPRYDAYPRVNPIPSRGVIRELDPRWLVLVRVIAAVALIFLVAGIVRINLTNTAVAASLDYDTVASELNTARAEGGMLEVQAANLSNPAYVKEYAKDRLGMAAPETVETMTLGEDVVAYGEDGRLSLSQTLAAAARG